jgi:hypothetical protein
MVFMQLLWECKRVVIFGLKRTRKKAFVGWRTELVTTNIEVANCDGGVGSET